MSKNYNPTISEDLHQILIDKYIEKRQLQRSASNEGDKYYTTRSLLALIRLCQARVIIILYRLD
jgi:DNA replication licensing factor MCM7